MPIFNFLISGLVAYLTHQAVQAIGSTARFWIAICDLAKSKLMAGKLYLVI